MSEPTPFIREETSHSLWGKDFHEMSLSGLSPRVANRIRGVIEEEVKRIKREREVANQTLQVGYSKVFEESLGLTFVDTTDHHSVHISNEHLPALIEWLHSYQRLRGDQS